MEAANRLDAAVRSLDVRAAPSVTDVTPLIGADGYRALWNARHALAERSGLHVARIEHLLHRYGTYTHELLEMIKERPTLAEPLPGAVGSGAQVLEPTDQNHCAT